MKNKRRFFFLFLFLLAVGICSGAFFEVFLRGSVKERLCDMLGSFLLTNGRSAASFASCFWYACRRGLIAWFLCVVSPLFFPLLLLLPVLILAKGFAVGFASAMTLESLGLRGIVEIAFTLLLQNLLQIPLLCLLAAIACDISLLDQKEKSGNLRVKARRCRIGSPQSTGQYLLFSFCVLLILIFSWLLEAFLSA